MNARISRILIGLVVLSALLPASSAFAVAVNVLPGWDLFQTLPGTNFQAVPFTGVPLGTFNFGGTIGTQSVGPTDTIVQRLSTATAPSLPGTAPTIPIEMLSLQLVSTAPVDFGLGVDFYYITLQSARGGPATTGNMDISFVDATGGTFNSFFDVFFDIRKGSLSGPIAISSDLTLTGTANGWNRIPPPGSITINGVNQNLNGTNNASDFWPIPPVTEQHPGQGVHVVTDAALPEPASIGTLGIAAALFLRRSRH